LLDACENVGERIAQRDAEALKAAGREIDLDAPRGLTAFFEWGALEYPQVACAMLARLMPTQQQTEVKVEHTYHTMEEIAARLRELGLEPRRIYPLGDTGISASSLTRHHLHGRHQGGHALPATRTA
jgi:hypothetical protein